MTAANWVLAGVAVIAAMAVIAVIVIFVTDWRREALSGRHANIPGPPPEVAHEDPPPGHGFLPAPTLAPLPPPLAGVPVPAPRKRHECAGRCRLPVPVSLAAFAVLTAALGVTAPAVAREMGRLEDEARFPWLRSGQYAGHTGDFTRRDAELVLAALEAELAGAS